MIIFGGDKNTLYEFLNFILIIQYVNQLNMYFIISSASLVKYSINTFLATKAYFYEVHDVFISLIIMMIGIHSASYIPRQKNWKKSYECSWT